MSDAGQRRRFSAASLPPKGDAPLDFVLSDHDCGPAVRHGRRIQSLFPPGPQTSVPLRPAEDQRPVEQKPETSFTGGNIKKNCT